jgi:ABC-type uncharacterized transport system ATPase subunit
VDTLCDHLLILKAGHALLSGRLDEVMRDRQGTLEDVFLELTR